MATKRVCIIGGGLAGLSVAYFLQQKKVPSFVFEQDGQAGGLCRSKKTGGFVFDRSGHVLHFKHQETLLLVKKLLGANLAMHQRNAWVYSGSGFVRYPFQANLYGLPRAVAQECLVEFVKARCARGGGNSRPESFADWIVRTFGKGIARHFMLPYNRKFWKVPVSSLTAEWADDFIPVPTLNELIEGSLGLSSRQFGYNAQFWYPRRGGMQSLIDALVRKTNGVETGRKVVEVDLVSKRLRLERGGWERYDTLISTMPLPEWSGTAVLPGPVRTCLRALRWTSVRTFNLGVRSVDTERRHWMYFPQRHIPFFRAGFSHGFSPDSAPAGTHALYVECSRPGRKTPGAWPGLDSIRPSLCSAGLLGEKDTIVAKETVDIPYGYVIYDSQRAAAVKKIKDYLAGRGVFCAGRYGAWEYLSMEGTMRQAQRTAEHCG